MFAVLKQLDRILGLEMIRTHVFADVRLVVKAGEVKARTAHVTDRVQVARALA